MKGKRIYQSLYFQVLTAISIGILLGHFFPETGAAMKPLGDGFIKLIKMIIAPVIFCTVVTGIEQYVPLSGAPFHSVAYYWQIVNLSMASDTLSVLHQLS